MSRRPVGLVAVLIAIWLLAWGSVSWANVLSGIAVAIGLMIVLPDIRHADHLPGTSPEGGPAGTGRPPP